MSICICMRHVFLFNQGRGLVLRYRHGRRLEGGKKGMYGLMLSEVSGHSKVCG